MVLVTIQLRGCPIRDRVRNYERGDSEDFVVERIKGWSSLEVAIIVKRLACLILNAKFDT